MSPALPSPSTIPIDEERRVTVELLATNRHAETGHRKRPYDPAVCDCRVWAEMVFDVIDHPDDPAWRRARRDGQGSATALVPIARPPAVIKEET